MGEKSSKMLQKSEISPQEIVRENNMQQQEALFVEDINASDKSTFILDLNPVSIKAQIMPHSMRNVKTNIRNALSQKKTNL